MSEYLIFVPVFNEEKNLHLVFNELNSFKNEDNIDIIIINSGSTDNSKKIIEDTSFNYLNIEKNLGVGFVNLKAIEYAKSKNYKYICAFSGNGKMKYLDLHNLIKELSIGKAQYIHGSRYLSESSTNTPLIRNSLIFYFSKFVNLFSKNNITDITCGLFGFKLEILNEENLFNILKKKKFYKYRLENYLYAYCFFSKKISTKEIPATMDYGHFFGSYTKIKINKDFIQFIGPWIYFIFKKINPLSTKSGT